MKTINEMTAEIHGLAKEKGWWDNPRTPLEIHMLFVTEVAEASEEVRNKKPDYYFNTPTGIITLADMGGGYDLSVGPELQKPEGELSEIADVVIRILDYCGHKGWDLEKAISAKHDFNRTRRFKHGGKAL